MDEFEQPGGSGTFFVDMLCGGVGAVFTLILLLSIVGASAPPPPVRGPIELVLKTDQSDQPPPRIGVICVAPTGAEFAVLADEPGVTAWTELDCDVTVQSGMIKPAENKYQWYLKVRLSTSIAGRWQFKPYVVEHQTVPYANDSRVSWNATLSNGLTLSVLGRVGGQNGELKQLKLHSEAGNTSDTIVTMEVP